MKKSERKDAVSNIITMIINACSLNSTQHCISKEGTGWCFYPSNPPYKHVIDALNVEAERVGLHLHLFDRGNMYLGTPPKRDHKAGLKTLLENVGDIGYESEEERNTSGPFNPKDIFG